MIPLSIGRLLAASVVVAILGLGSVLVLPIKVDPAVDIRVEPNAQTVTLNEPFTVTVLVEASAPVNVFKGNLHFDPEVMVVNSISYNSSIADLWAEEPWYSNGAGTINFIGGTTRAGGFTGTDSLLSVTFLPVTAGNAVLTLHEARVLLHDGLGTDATLADPIDGLFTVAQEVIEEQTVFKKSGEESKVAITPKEPTTDLNNDGKQTIADLSIFMRHLVTQDPASDFNGDGTVGSADLSILMAAD